MEQLRAADVKLQARPAGYPIPLIPWQLRVWNAMMERGTQLSNWTIYGASVRILGSLNVPVLRECMKFVVQRHESLRTRIISVEGVPRQQVDQAGECLFQVIDLERLAPGDAELAARRFIQDFADTDRDLSTGPLFETKLIRLSSSEHLFLVALDHMFSDILSIGILSRDIWTFYNQTVRGQSPSLPSLPVQFADYSVWQEQTYEIWKADHEAYWRERLNGAKDIQFSFDGDSKKAKIRSITIVNFSLGEMLSGKLRDIARQEGTLFSLVILAIYAAVIARWCNQRDIVLTFISHGRHSHPELQNMIGLLPQQLFFRIELEEEDTFRTSLKRIIREFNAAHQHQDYNRVRDIIPQCPTDFCFNWAPGNLARSNFNGRVRGDSSLEIQPLQVHRSHQDLDPVDAWYNFTLVPHETPAGLLLEVAYRDCLFTPGTIENFVRCFRLLAEEFTKSSLASVTAVPLRDRESVGFIAQTTD